MRLVAIIDYGSGNLRSAAKAFERVAPEDCAILVTSNPKKLAEATHIVLPGVGAFADCMEGLQKTSGMLEALENEVLVKRKPFLGICVGMQMLFEIGHEHGVHKGLGWIDGEIIKIDNAGNPQLKVPHMGWNELSITSAHPLLAGINTGAHVYFVHSYHAICDDKKDRLATTDYGSPLAAVVAKDNIMGTQFHPEKSQETGLRLISNFLQLGK